MPYVLGPWPQTSLPLGLFLFSFTYFKRGAIVMLQLSKKYRGATLDCTGSTTGLVTDSRISSFGPSCSAVS